MKPVDCPYRAGFLSGLLSYSPGVCGNRTPVLMASCCSGSWIGGCFMCCWGWDACYELQSWVVLGLWIQLEAYHPLNMLCKLHWSLNISTSSLVPAALGFVWFSLFIPELVIGRSKGSHKIKHNNDEALDGVIYYCCFTDNEAKIMAVEKTTIWWKPNWPSGNNKRSLGTLSGSSREHGTRGRWGLSVQKGSGRDLRRCTGTLSANAWGRVKKGFLSGQWNVLCAQKVSHEGSRWHCPPFKHGRHVPQHPLRPFLCLHFSSFGLCRPVSFLSPPSPRLPPLSWVTEDSAVDLSVCPQEPHPFRSH